MADAIEIRRLAALLGAAIADIGYPCGCGLPPSPQHCQAIAETVLATTPARTAPIPIPSERDRYALAALEEEVARKGEAWAAAELLRLRRLLDRAS